MKVFLAGCEGVAFGRLPLICGHKNLLFSYYHLCVKGTPGEEFHKFMSDPEIEVICDSGLFTLMFGAGKGGNYDLDYMKDYTKTYLKKAKDFKMKNLTIVEADVHKLLGMKAVFELRKMFEDSDFNVLYVWHREEGIDGLYKMAEKYPYIALSVPELRNLCKDKLRYQDAVHDLLGKLTANVKDLPRIHLLGNTIQDTMEQNIAYSCDSTSWLSGGRYGRYVAFKNGRLTTSSIYDEEYTKAKYLLENKFKNEFALIDDKWGKSGKKKMDYMIAMYLSARSYALYQNWLDKNFKCIGGKNEAERKHRDSGHSKGKTKQMESKQTN